MNEVNTGAFAVNYKSGFQLGIFKPIFPKLSASRSSLPRVVCIFQTFRQASESAQCRQRRWGRFYLAWEKGRFWGHLAIESFTTHRAQLSLCVRACAFFFFFLQVLHNEVNRSVSFWCYIMAKKGAAIKSNNKCIHTWQSPKLVCRLLSPVGCWQQSRW